MKTKNLISGMQILLPYYDNEDGYHCSAEHDEFFMGSLDKPISKKDFDEMVRLGWSQTGSPIIDGEHANSMEHAHSGWKAFT